MVSAVFKQKTIKIFVVHDLESLEAKIEQEIDFQQGRHEKQCALHHEITLYGYRSTAIRSLRSHTEVP